jgi:hypothetical protein
LNLISYVQRSVQFSWHSLQAVRDDFRHRSIAVEVAFAPVAAGSVSSNRAAFALAVDANLASAHRVRA